MEDARRETRRTMSPSPNSHLPMGNALRALLIDDEAPARAVLRTLLEDHPEVAIAGEAETLGEARALLAQSGYDLVFLDIQLLGGSGFDLVPHVRPDAQIVFVTAFDRHALRAFEVNALDYLIKPIAPERLAASLRRLGRPAPVSPLSSPSPRLSSPLALDDRVLLKLGTGSERFVRLADVRMVASCENYSEVLLGGGERLFVRKTMKTWEDLLPPEHFVRAHRRAIVNLQHVERVERLTVSTSLLHLAGASEPVRASYRYVAALRDKWQR